MSAVRAGERGLPIALVGLRGAGKTTAGRLLAEALGTAFVDLDAELAASAGATSAGALLLAAGEPRFRELEVAELERLLPGLGAGDVLATGGGVVESPAACELLRERALCVWLDVAPACAAGRLAGDATLRPALLGADARTELPELATRRAPLYRSVCNHRVDATVSAERVAAEIAALVRTEH